MHAICQTIHRQQRFHRFAVGGANLNHRAQFFVEQRSQTVVAQRGDIGCYAAVTGKSHFRQRH